MKPKTTRLQAYTLVLAVAMATLLSVGMEPVYPRVVAVIILVLCTLVLGMSLEDSAQPAEVGKMN